jgi:predicted DNA-binding ribbon-helix-helix protein
MKGNYRRYDMIGAINFWCSKNGLGYFTYIEKKTKAQLEEIVAQYDINVDEMLFEIDKERETAANFTENLKQNLAQTIQKNIDYFVGKIEMLESLLNDEQKEKYLEYCHSQNST